MKQIRRGTFETNSSSTHSLTMVNECEYKDWEDGKVYYNGYSAFKTFEDIVRELRCSKYHANDPICAEDFDPTKWAEYAAEDEDGCTIFSRYESLDDYLAHELEYYTYNQFWDTKGEYYETFEEQHTTPSGDVVVAFGYYGYDC